MPKELEIIILIFGGAMKVSIIAFSNLFRSPYVNIYADFCKKNGLEYEIIFPNRSGMQESADCPLISVPWDRSKKKIFNILAFRKAAIQHLKKAKSDFVIVLTTMPAVLMSGYLARHYKGRYLIDIRDYTYESVFPYYFLEKRAIKNAAMTVISSPGFRKFLPDGEYHLCHNVNALYRDEKGGNFVPTGGDPITIGYVGSIGYKSQCLKLIKLVEQDERFCFDFYGEEGADGQISAYLKENPCDRIKMYGAYKPQEKVGIMEKVDILFNAYGNGNKLVDYALSNKLYDSFYMRIPLLTSPNTAMSEEAGDYSFDIDFETMTSLDALYEWYRAIDANSFDQYSEQYLQQVFSSQDAFYEKLGAVLLK